MHINFSFFFIPSLSTHLHSAIIYIGFYNIKNKVYEFLSKMVLKNLVRYLINKYLKDYIEELDYEKLKLDLKNGIYDLLQPFVKYFIVFFSSGHVCLEKLHLKPEALVS